MDSNWTTLARPPKDALKEIKGGRLKGFTDINPVWRLEIMDTVFGPCGSGWSWELVKSWTEKGDTGEIALFVHIVVRVHKEGYGQDIHGVGGSLLVAKESSGLRLNDEALKMATTDALSYALKCLGVGADIYRNRWDGAKYNDPPPASGQKKKDSKADTPPEQPPADEGLITKEQLKKINEVRQVYQWSVEDMKKMLAKMKLSSAANIRADAYEDFLKFLTLGPSHGLLLWGACAMNSNKCEASVWSDGEWRCKAILNTAQPQCRYPKPKEA